ncbi:ribosomal protein S23 [Kluyveromyces marxianus]|uniref:Ribosomal protein S23 n=1 Tax=Kluyveromyces marxianus TaxID=4911 RepID=A0ABX6F7M5_KLUMA|nr:ribosomal protein S23 [Kluyveromyces marxianus]
MGKGKPRGLNSARKLRVHRRNKYVTIENPII